MYSVDGNKDLYNHRIGLNGFRTFFKIQTALQSVIMQRNGGDVHGIGNKAASKERVIIFFEHIQNVLESDCVLVLFVCGFQQSVDSASDPFGQAVLGCLAVGENASAKVYRAFDQRDKIRQVGEGADHWIQYKNDIKEFCVCSHDWVF
jgi:hypothetical protein